MSDGAALSISTTRVRAVSLASGALVVALICAALLALSRVAAYLDQPPAIILVEITPRSETRPAPARAQTPAQSRVAHTAAPAPTSIPVGREMFARTLHCFRLRAGEPRPPECPPPTQAQLETFGGNFPTDRQLDLILNPPQNTAQAFAGIPPSCIPGVSAAPEMAGVQVCIRGGLVPQEASRSAEEVCRAGGIGPCTPPAFRAEDVVRLPHTQ